MDHSVPGDIWDEDWMKLGHMEHEDPTYDQLSWLATVEAGGKHGHSPGRHEARSCLEFVVSVLGIPIDVDSFSRRSNVSCDV